MSRRDERLACSPPSVTQKCYKTPRANHSLSTLRHIYSTGSPLAAPLFDFVYEQISPNVLLGSITGQHISRRSEPLSHSHRNFL